MLSSQKITIERVFAMLFHCFGILSRRLVDYKLANIFLIITVTARIIIRSVLQFLNYIVNNSVE